MREETRAGERQAGTADDWWRHAVIYQIYPRSFMDANGDGTGDLPGIVDRLDYVRDLGVDAIWISPFFKSPMRDFGYDVSDYRAVDPLFGTLADFDRLLEGAHQRGLKVIIDQVLSHSSDQHPWFLASRESRDNAKADWYVWANAKPDGGPPNNWLSVFGGGAWQWEPRRGQHYLHNFLASQPDLNCHNAEVRQASLDNLEFWLKRGVDGFRLDAVNFCMHDPQLRDNPPKSDNAQRFLSGPGASPYAMQEHRFDHSHPNNLAFMANIRQLLERYGAVALGEIGSDNSQQALAEYTRGENRLHMAYSFDFMGDDCSPAFLHKTLTALRPVAEQGWLCLAFGNHDVRRVASRWTDGTADAAAARLFNVLLGCLRGAVCLYQGDELGLPEADVPYERLQDPYGLNFWPTFKGRDGCRTPMPWRADAPHAGFTTAEPWLPVDARHYPLAVDRQLAAADTTLARVRTFLAFRKAQPALMHGEQTLLPPRHDALAFTRTTQDQTLLLCFNPGPAPRRLPPPTTLFAETVPAGAQLRELEGHGATPGRMGPDGLAIPPWGAWIGEVV